jgi:xanthine dehydrogenase accessory factor
VDIYIDPLLPPPRLLVFGRSPIAQALARLAKAMGYAVDAIDPGADRAAFPEADRLVATLDPARLRPRLGSLDGRLFAVVATMGQYDEEALLTALALEPAYVGVIASRTRFAQPRDAIAACGAPTDGIERIKCPAGLDIGAQTPEEIALSVLAEIVRVRRATEKELGQVESIPGDADEARDPVCGMMVSIAAAVHHAELGGRTFYFCCGGCRALFLSEPERYADAISAGEHSRAPP